MAIWRKNIELHAGARLNKNSFTQKVLAAGFAGLLLTSFGPVAHAQNAGNATGEANQGSHGPHASSGRKNAGLKQLGSCVSQRKNLDVVLLMDETGSLASTYKGGQKTDRPGSDSENNRIPAAQGFIDQLTDLGVDRGVKTRVMLAGFGGKYKSHSTEPDAYIGWKEVSPETNGDLKDEIEKFGSRVEEMETNHALGIQGAYKDLMNANTEDNPCRLLVTFTDGELAVTQGQEQVKNDLCRPGGLADQLRAQGITHVGIGLSGRNSPQNFSLMKKITEGGGECGKRPGDGAFFEATDVGSLFTGFHQALNLGGETSEEVEGDQPFRFWLDSSITDLRFNVISQGKLTDKVTIQLVAPSGEVIDLKETGEGELGGSKVSWSTHRDPVLRSSGKLSKGSNSRWDGEWSIRLVNLSPEEKSTKVFNSVEMQPGLNIRVNGKDSSPVDESSGKGNRTTDTTQLQLREDGKLSLELANNEGKVHEVAGSAVSVVKFHPADGSTPIPLGGPIDMKSGRAEISVDHIKDLPASGRVEVSTTVTTKGPEGREGTKLSPIVNSTALSVTPNDLPQLPGQITFNAQTDEATVEVPVQGPGRVWIPSGTKIKADVLPDGVDSLPVSAENQDSGSALNLDKGQSGTLKIKLIFPEGSEGTVGGTLPITVSTKDGQKESVAQVAIKGSKTIPLNSTKFTIGLIAALLGAIIVPLLLLYAMRWFTARVDKKQSFGAQRISLTKQGASISYNGQSAPHIDINEVADNRVLHDGVRFNATGSGLAVKKFTANPFTVPPVEAVLAPSISSSGKQNSKLQAQLPLAVQGDWFLTYNEVSRGIDLIVLPRLPLLEEDRQRMVNDILDKAPSLYDILEGQLPQGSGDSYQADPSTGGWNRGSFGSGSASGGRVKDADSAGGWNTSSSGNNWNQASPNEGQTNQGGWNTGNSESGWNQGPADTGFGNGASGGTGFAGNSASGGNPGNGWSQPPQNEKPNGWGPHRE
ncbi:hypothetical protein [Corynebacterium auriscanis]|uniref:hypothetical protein n=1 Tax=Corynebacterium auriscanis TaxID=99807 RepID=UPI0025B46110|nr:hypothetical protein [Corynebacterium auriscanis]WJY73584.1 hypothetical protein CAURIC_09905 [Corynebacterium auriscanis]